MKPSFTAGQFVEVLVARPFAHGFDYRVPEGMALDVGGYVSVPFGRQQMVGVVWGPARGDVAKEQCKDILAQHEHVPPMTERMRKFIEWTAHYTMAERGMVLKMAVPLPQALTEPAKQVLYGLSGLQPEKLTAQRKAVMDALTLMGPLTATALQEQAGVGASIVSAMVKAGLLIRQERVLRESSAKPWAACHANAPALSVSQQQIAATLKQQQGFQVSLLDGVTGSGKTEVYFDVIEHHLKQADAQILVLLPEIALATQWTDRFRERFGEEPVLWHSSVPMGARKRNWTRVATGAARLVVGARSALYLPFKSLSLVVVDEEHEVSYKQEDGVLYQARDMAVARAKIEQAPIILVSATPSLESVSNVAQGKYQEYRLHSRFGGQDMPTIHRIDLRQDKPERGCFLSPALRQALITVFAAGNQSMLFLNRRGYAPLLLCRHCGYRFACAQCSAWMVKHQHPSRLECHHCGAKQPLPAACPECHATDELVACGPGVERIHEEVSHLLPQARVVSLTSDETMLAQTIRQIIDKQVDIIVGTQLVAKGHHFPHLALVGVVDADLGLAGGDLRASERTYQLLHQLAGRAGREATAGDVYLQTVQPDHPVMQALCEGSRDAFIACEMAQRERGGWPPYGKIVALLFDGPKEADVMRLAQQVARVAPPDPKIRLLGPAPAPLSKLRNQYRVRLLVKAQRDVKLQAYLHQWLSAVTLPSAIRLKVDVDPYNFL